MRTIGSGSTHVVGRGPLHAARRDVRVRSADRLPHGTVSFLFTDVETSTALLTADPVTYREAVARHHEILAASVEDAGGVVFETVGDAVYAAFQRPTDAVNAALKGQLGLHSEPWPPDCVIRVRMGLHVGEVEVRGAHYFGIPLVRCARLMSVAYGGQVVMSEPLAGIVRDVLPDGAELRSLGEHRLKDLARPEHVFQLLHPALPAEFPPLRSLNVLPNNLPAQLTSFVGREREVDEVRRLIEKSRLVTLIGSAGCGKTRLAIQVAAELVDRFGDGAFFVDLASVRDPSLLMSAIAATLGIRETVGQVLAETVAVSLRNRQLLLVLDNFEQLVSAAPRVSEFVLACPGLHVLVTSRTSLHVRGETQLLVGPLEIPEPGTPTDDVEGARNYSAVQLFVERAGEIRQEFTLSQANLKDVVEICRKLDGLPLAIELAAARVKVLPVEALLARLGWRLNLLTGGARDAPRRQQTLRTAIDWSYMLLTEEQQALFRSLAVFRGGCELDGVEAVCSADHAGSDPLERMTSLVDDSLVQQTETHGEPRFELLQTVREYAQEQLDLSGESEPVQQRHAAFYLTLVEQSERALVGPEQGRWLNRLDRELDNIRLVLEWAFASDQIDTVLRVASALWRFWATRGYLTEGQAWLERGLSRSGRRSAVEAKASTVAGSLARLCGDRQRARALHTESLLIFQEVGDKAGIARSLSNLGVVAKEQGDYASATTLYEQSLELRRELGDTWAIAALLVNLGEVAREQGDAERARYFYEQSRQLFEDVGDTVGIAVALNNLGEIAREQGSYADAVALHQRSYELRRDIGDKLGMARSLDQLARLAVLQNDPRRALRLLVEGLQMREQPGAEHDALRGLEAFANVATLCGETETAARLFAAAEALRAPLAMGLTAEEQSERDRSLSSIRAAIDTASLERALAEGARLTLTETIALAFECREIR